MVNHVLSGTHSLSQSEIAAMTDEQLTRLNYDALVEVVLASNVPVNRVENIRSFEGDTICRLARKARNHCRRATSR